MKPPAIKTLREAAQRAESLAQRELKRVQELLSEASSYTSLASEIERLETHPNEFTKSEHTPDNLIDS